LQFSQRFLNSLIGFFGASLHFNLQHFVEGMGNAIASETHIWIFEQIDAHEISEGVVLKGNAVSHRICHFLPSYHFHVLMIESLFVGVAQLDAEILAHRCLVLK